MDRFIHRLSFNVHWTKACFMPCQSNHGKNEVPILGGFLSHDEWHNKYMYVYFQCVFRDYQGSC